MITISELEKTSGDHVTLMGGAKTTDQINTVCATIIPRSKK